MLHVRICAGPYHGHICGGPRVRIMNAIVLVRVSASWTQLRWAEYPHHECNCAGPDVSIMGTIMLRVHIMKTIVLVRVSSS